MRELGALEFSLDAELGAEPPVECRTILYRIAQEALTNVRKHARATNVRIEVRSEGTGVTMRIRDDGVGFDPASAPNGAGAVGHVGIPSMRERAHLAGGWVHFDSSPGRGTTVEVWVPRIMAEDANASPAGPAREARAAADPA
jgi:signal transduction histidine kinase